MSESKLSAENIKEKFSLEREKCRKGEVFISESFWQFSKLMVWMGCLRVSRSSLRNTSYIVSKSMKGDAKCVQRDPTMETYFIKHFSLETIRVVIIQLIVCIVSGVTIKLR